MAHTPNIRHRLDKNAAPSVRNWREKPGMKGFDLERNAVTHAGWGRLVWGQTFDSPETIAETLLQEKRGERDIAFYLRDPHVVLSMAPDRLFLDPSHTYRLWLSQYRPSKQGRPPGFVIRRADSLEDATAMNRIYEGRGMVTADPAHVYEKRHSRTLAYFVAQEEVTGEVIGTITGVDHVHAFNDPEHGASFWCLSVDKQAQAPGVGEALVRHVIEYFQAKGRNYVDLSVMHDNEQAIALYDKLGFTRVPVFAIKRKNPINEPLFTPHEDISSLNPYAAIVVNEAQRRGIEVCIEDPETGHFRLTFGGRSVLCWESLSEMTSAMAFVRCDDKSLTHRVLARAGLNVPEQRRAGSDDENLAFLQKHGSVVVKPCRGEQGVGISVDVRDEKHLAQAVAAARKECDTVILERFAPGDDLRIIVIDHKLVAAAVRKPARIKGTGTHTVAELIEKQSRRRAAATGGESRIPVDAETERCVRDAGHDMASVPDKDEVVVVRKTANLHTGGTIHDVTPRLSPTLARASEEASRALDIVVVGFDFIVPDVEGEEYVIIEANERPGLANHEPQPTAERYVDLLFPRTAADRVLP